MTLLDDGTIRVSDAELEYRMVGPRPDRAPTLVLLHEGLGSVAMWRDFPDRLAAATGYGVFLYSRQGYGGSSPCALPRPLSYMHEEGEQVLPALLEAIGFQRGLLVGHSDGASIAAIHGGGAAGPGIAGLVLIAPHFFTERAGLESIAKAKEAYETGGLRGRLIKYHGANVDGAFWGWNRAWLDPGFRRWDLTPYLPRITVPVLVIQGEDDQYGTVAQVEAAAQGCAGPVTTTLLPECGHSPQRDQPERTLEAISGFIRETSSHYNS